MSERPDESHPPDAGTPGPTIIDVVPEPARSHLVARIVTWLPLAVAVVLLAAAPFWAPPLAQLLPWSPAPKSAAPDPAIAAGIDRLEQKLGALAERQGALDQQLTRLAARPPADTTATSALQEQAAAMRLLADRLTLLEQRPGAPAPVDNTQQLAALAGELHRLGDRIGLIEGRATAAVAATGLASERTDQALLLALGRVREALAGARPFAAELATLERLGRDRPEVAAALPALAAAAPKGVPAVAVLARRFSQEVAPAVMRVVAVPESGGWRDYLLGRLRGLVSARRGGDSGIKSGDPVEAALARAEAALAAGDLAAGIAAVESLPERALPPAQAWLAEARMRLAAAQAVARLDDALAARLATDAAPAAER